MVYLVSDHIITPLGDGVQANLQAIRQGKSQISLHHQVHGEQLVTPVMASLLDEQKYQMDGYTFFESLCIHAVEGAIKDISCAVHEARCVFILSSTKGDIWCSMYDTAKRIALHFGNKEKPIVVSTACTSGVSAQLTAWRLLESGVYDRAVVVGCDVQREFIISGFQSFKALSDEDCRPFDKDRKGLNAGEAVACMILDHYADSGWQLLGGSIHNDANHISGPSRTAEGSMRCLEDALKRVDTKELAMVSVHGTGTAYNDEMESIALHRAGLDEIPVTALKGYYGHTMGAAGLLETILSLHALDEHVILPSRGYSEEGTTYAVQLSTEVRQTDKPSMIKLLSGFGGVNAAVVWRMPLSRLCEAPSPPQGKGGLVTLAEVRIDHMDDLVALYRERVGDYPKFFKMDTLSRLGFMAVELLLQQVREEKTEFAFDTEHCALILANRNASLKNDRDYQKTIEDKGNYYPSPAIFVYTLPNIVTGEISIRHKLYGETACYILDREQDLDSIVESTLSTSAMTQAVVGWVECENENNYTAHIRLIIKKTNSMEALKLQLKEEIIEALNLEDMTPADIEDAAPLFGEGLGLDSIDALELIMILDKNYGIKFANKEESKLALRSVDCMAEYVTAHRTK